MQANDDNQDDDDALEGLAQLEQQNPYAGAPIHTERTISNSNLVKRRKYLIKERKKKEAYSMLEGQH